MINQTDFQELINKNKQLKNRILKYTLRLEDKITKLTCNETVKEFLKQAVNECFVYSDILTGDVEILNELLHSPRLNLQNLNLGSTINVEQMVQHPECWVETDKQTNKKLLYLNSMVNPEFPCTLTIHLKNKDQAENITTNT